MGAAWLPGWLGSLLFQVLTEADWTEGPSTLRVPLWPVQQSPSLQLLPTVCYLWSATSETATGGWFCCCCCAGIKIQRLVCAEAGTLPASPPAVLDCRLRDRVCLHMRTMVCGFSCSSITVPDCKVIFVMGTYVCPGCGMSMVPGVPWGSGNVPLGCEAIIIPSTRQTHWVLEAPSYRGIRSWRSAWAPRAHWDCEMLLLVSGQRVVGLLWLWRSPVLSADCSRTAGLARVEWPALFSEGIASRGSVLCGVCDLCSGRDRICTCPEQLLLYL